MDRFLKRVKTNAMINAFIYAGLGLVLTMWPVTSASVLCWTLGAVLLVSGVIDILFFLNHRDGSLYSGGMLILGIILAALGIWIITSPQLVAILVPRVIGVLICLHGIANLKDAITLQRSGYTRWGAVLALAIVTLALGGFLVFYTFSVLSTIVRIIGLFLLYDGISDIWITSRVSNAVKQTQNDPLANFVDVEFRDENTSDD